MRFDQWLTIYNTLRNELAAYVRQEPPPPEDARHPEGWDARFDAHCALANREITFDEMHIDVRVEGTRLSLWVRQPYDHDGQRFLGEAHLYALSAERLRHVATVRERFERWMDGFEPEPPDAGAWR